ncbi:hypothetical protein [Marinomonas spartinae]|uniref:hypothetical protein n=1 Tax=Marinomonas spartinae TaxID=1792290 RepID=UPI0018F1E8F7|nr:hypothetical protein [Marinomonas spartinae]MBJ7556758.1 hypothetical protein [Marinomonas spartinae]
MDTLGIQRLAEYALGLTPDQTDALIDNGEDYDTPLKERFGIDLETFGKVANALISLTPMIEEPDSHRLIHAFVTFQNGCGTIITKQPISPMQALDEEVS